MRQVRKVRQVRFLNNVMWHACLIFVAIVIGMSHANVKYSLLVLPLYYTIFFIYNTMQK